MPYTKEEIYNDNVTKELAVHVKEILRLLGENPEREGKYLIKDVKITFSQNGWRRENTLSYKL